MGLVGVAHGLGLVIHQVVKGGLLVKGDDMAPGLVDEVLSLGIEVAQNPVQGVFAQQVVLGGVRKVLGRVVGVIRIHFGLPGKEVYAV